MIKVSTLLSSTFCAPKKISPSSEFLYASLNEMLVLPGVVAQYVSRGVGEYSHECIHTSVYTRVVALCCWCASGVLLVCTCEVLH